MSLADKVHNARAILYDYREVGEELWSRFRGSREESLWYYRELAEIFCRRRPGPLADELRRTVDEIDALAGRLSEDRSGRDILSVRMHPPGRRSMRPQFMSRAVLLVMLALIGLALPASAGAKSKVLRPASYPDMTTYSCRTDAIPIHPGRT